MQVGDSTEIFGCLECDRIEEESKELWEKSYGPLTNSKNFGLKMRSMETFFRLGRRLFFYHRAQQILDIMHPAARLKPASI
jgi:hypothetical protein